MIGREFATRFAQEWIEAWNSHDLDRILAHYSEDFVMSSPRIALLAGEASGVLRGKPAIADYWEKALAAAPDLHFELLETFAGADCVVLRYRGVRSPAAEVFFFDEARRVVRAAASHP